MSKSTLSRATTPGNVLVIARNSRMLGFLLIEEQDIQREGLGFKNPPIEII
jgi:hypothetical protein